MTTLLSSCTREGIFIEEGELTASEIEYYDRTAEESELFDLVNEYRMSVNLSALIHENYTHFCATQHSLLMISKGNISHVDYNKRANKLSKRTGAILVGENVAKDYTSNQKALEAWIKSDGHRENIEGDFTHSAISIQKDTKGKPYYTQIFYK